MIKVRLERGSKVAGLTTPVRLGHVEIKIQNLLAPRLPCFFAAIPAAINPAVKRMDVEGHNHLDNVDIAFACWCVD